MSPRAEEPVPILLVEDNPGDARLVREALQDLARPFDLRVVEDGVEALAFLRREGAHAAAPRPRLVLMDLNLPKLDGRDVLEILKQDPLLRRIPVVVLTSSESERDVRSCYDLHANCYVAKPVHLDRFLRAVQASAGFWLGVARLPQE